MKKIVLICGSGMSTSLLAARMQDAADESGYPCRVSAFAASDIAELDADVSLILLGPQVRFRQKAIEAQVACPVMPIEFSAYGRMDGAAILRNAREVLDD
ncbi:PTS sugar transporter subunit IIB [Olsenella sp. SW781]|uniref:PTS sugar transporter subunit IIB n=1 Tax=Olsenella sp. SW781 TaxID=2530046 RepID=UPI00143AFB1F|nr:PTS sugar transporter subunit IIB [Olsenella sp. SW781]NJE80967.1 PTS sugar transporter subunit IIB [Olsenella sp. SW781]